MPNRPQISYLVYYDTVFQVQFLIFFLIVANLSKESLVCHIFELRHIEEKSKPLPTAISQFILP